jgi:hypothetical protein
MDTILELNVKDGLMINPEFLIRANIGTRALLIIREGEILVKSAEVDAQKLLDELEGCLGEEKAEEYDFGLKIGGWYEAR